MITSRAVQPAPDTIVLSFDGAVAIRGAVAHSAYGWVAVRDGVVLTTGQGALPDDATSNVAEYSALLTGLETLLEQSLTGPLIVRGDSELVIDQVQGIKRVESDHLRPLHQRVKTALAAFESVRVEWIPRERNSAAHACAQAALSTLAWPTAPDRPVAAPTSAPVPVSVTPAVPPPFLKIYPGLAAQALKRDVEQGLGLWALARAIDEPGAGRVFAETLQQVAAQLGLAGSRDGKFKRALAQATACGLLAVVVRRRAGVTQKVIEIRSAERAAFALGATSLGARPVLIEATRLAKVGDWRAELWAAHLAGFARRSAPISQATLRDLTGVPERTQREYNRGGDIDVTYNIAVSKLDASDPETVMMAMTQHSGVFTVKDQATGQRRVAWSLPANYRVNRDRAPRGRMRKINRALRIGLVSDAAGQRAQRVFFSGDKAQQAAVKSANREFNNLYYEQQRAGQPAPEPAQLPDRYYARGRTRSGRGKWGQL